MSKVDGRTRYWVYTGKDFNSNKTVILEVVYLGQCGCGFSRKITRVIEMKENQTLDDLHDVIIFQSFRWDDPHMYSFHFDNIAYSKNRKKEYCCDPESFERMGEEKPKSSAIKLSALKLKKNQKFLFVFDFGDDHRFGITVKYFREVQKGVKYPIIIEEKGKAPRQYR